MEKIKFILGIVVRIMVLIFIGVIIYALLIIFPKEMPTQENVLPIQDVVYRVELVCGVSGGNLKGEKKILTESGAMLTADSNCKAFFLEKGDTIMIKENKIFDIKFKY